ncbi:MAG TPA: DUF1800 family protein [Rudaea sp.]
MGTATVSAQSLSHAPEIVFHDGYEGPAAGPFYDSDAARFLAQATFGPTDADIAHLRAVGYQGWLNEQFTAVPTFEMDYINWVENTLGENIGQENRKEAWFLGALGGPDPQNHLTIHNDQLRQRVAFALSEIFVVSQENTVLDLYGAKGLAYYNDILIRDAFGDFRTLLEDVTLSPEMGVYLNMVGNRRADLSHNQHPDENYAREINQLFSVGLVMLNLDGTVQTSGGVPIPTYSQSTITNFAHVFTGWNWFNCDANGNDNFTTCGPDMNTGTNFISPMKAFDGSYPNGTHYPSYHDNGTDAVNDIKDKQLLSYPGAAFGGVVPNNQTAAQDLKFALDNIAGHPNVAPFISKQLIQRLITSNPTPAYVQRVATVFNANRGSATQLQAVVQAILLDPEARTGQWRTPDTYGKLREPLLTVTHLWRAMSAIHICGTDVGGANPAHYDNPYRYAGYTTAWSTNGSQFGGVNQAALDAPTVFNFFRPSYMPPGELSSLGLVAPEFQTSTNDSIIANTINTFEGFYISYDSDTYQAACPGNFAPFGEVAIDVGNDLALAAPTPTDGLVEAYNRRFMAGQMSPFMRKTLVTYLNAITTNGTIDYRRLRIQRALYLILTSPEYLIQK